AACVAGVDSHDRHACQFSFVLNECPQLAKTPTAHFRPLAFAKPCPRPDALEVFKSDPALRAFGQPHGLFADDVVLVSPETGLSIANPLQRPTCILACPPFVLSGHFSPERTTDAVVSLPHGFGGVPRNPFTVTGG